jgi:molybdate transport system regulatory protein
MSRVGPLKLKIMLFCGEDTAMGPGKAELLEAIEREGSIVGAGRSMQMSYRRAWNLVDMMNRSWTEPVVQTSVGGAGKGGARLTAFGTRLLHAYRDLEDRLMVAAQQGPFSEFEHQLLEAPRPSTTVPRATRTAKS